MNDRVTKGHDSTTCWQYDVRSANYEEDLKEAGFTEEYVSNLRCSDFDFRVVTDLQERERLKAFITKHEWLGNLSQYTTHWFACYHKDKLAGVLLFNLPNAFSKMLGEETPELERLISRGACISWSPKGLASKFIMWSINWMVDNTRYRLFTAYSDPHAKELGTVYQACGFYYLGKKSGTETRYINPYTGRLVSDRFFRQRSAYRRYAKELGIKWEKDWTTKTGINWQSVPDNIEKRLRAYSKDKQATSTVVFFPSKHKYAFVLGRDKRETRRLRKLFTERNKTFTYPKERGK
jgi:hypothetical protein